MSNSSRNLLIAVSLFLLGASLPGLLVAKGPPSAGEITVDSATPNFAEQGEQNKPIVLAGSNFPTYSKVRFRMNISDCPDEIGVSDLPVVEEEPIRRTSSTELGFDINVPDEATLGDYDICVYETDRFGAYLGRKGKGTTKLFSVRAKGNQNEEVSCDEFAPGGTCDCRFMLDPDTGIHKLLGDCKTSETLWLYHARIHSIDGGSNGLWPTITAVNNAGGSFNGSSVIANGSDVVGVRYFRIRFAETVSRGCSGTDIQSAIRFALDGDTDDDPDMNSLLQVWDMDIDSSGDPLCTAVELVRTPEFTKAGATGNRDWRIRVENSYIADGSYVESAIRLAGMQPQQDINPPLVFGNYIGAPDCGDPTAAVGIEFGPILLSEPSTQVAGVVESNTIRMSGCSAPGGAGIQVLGKDSFGEHMTAAEIIKNDISGAFFGVLVDEFVDSAHFSGNTLTGDGVSESGDVGVDSQAGCTDYKGKPNKFLGYDDDTNDLGCP